MTATPAPSALRFDDVRSDVEDVLGSSVVAHAAVAEGGYSSAGRWVVETEGAQSAFVKADRATSRDHGVALEHLVYSTVEAPCLPVLYGFRAGDGTRPSVLVTEDLSGAVWGPPVSAADAALLADAIDDIVTREAPIDLPPVALGKRWPALAAEPGPLLATGLVDAAWLTAHAEALIDAERPLRLDGDRLVHTDVWLQNWCRTPRGAVIVDWAGARRGDPGVMRAFGEAGVRAALGAAGVVVAPKDSRWSAWMAGQTAAWLAEEPPDAPARLLETERREAMACLRWAAASLDLPMPSFGGVFAELGPWRP